MSTAPRAPIAPIPSLRLARPPVEGGGELAGPLPRTGVLIIGTTETIAAIAAQMALTSGAPVVAGCLIVGESDPSEPTADRRSPVALPPVLGTIDDLVSVQATFRFRAAVVSLPMSLSGVQSRAIAGLQRLDLPYRVVPALSDLMDGVAIPPTPPAPAPKPAPEPTPVRVAPQTYRPSPTLDLATLIGRTPYDLDRASVATVLTGKRVLITGAGGSIGAELARVAAGFDPELLILMERSENALFEIDRQLAARFPRVARKAVLHDVVDAEGTLRHLVGLRPHAVFHAAAHKHVPLMEDHPSHAVTNNLFGTKSIADAAVAVGAERFVMISTDKAVNPTSVMGATKRLAEMYVRSLAQPAVAGGVAPGGRTRLSMVRFGNVLGSACSVLTIWSAQLAEGGPLTVTDPRMTRFFMTIPEAATLVIQSSVMPGDGKTRLGESGHPGAPVYVLDMGDPIRILDLAVRFARANGLAPVIRRDTAGTHEVRPIAGECGPNDAGSPTIDIRFTGTRPGEKLYEELAYAAELLRPTGYAGINAWAGPAPEARENEGNPLPGLEMIADLSAVRSSSDRATVLAAIRRHVPEMTRPTSE